VRRLEARLAGAGVEWVRLRYHKRPTLPATAGDVLRGIAVGRRIARARATAIVHARGYVPSVVALAVKRTSGARFVFDMRGFWADEKVDGGHWTRRSLPYRLAKRWERRFFEGADAIVSLTEAGVKAFPTLGYRIAPQTPVEVIPTCADLTVFRPGPRDAALAARLGLGDGAVIGYVGTLSNWYLREETLRYLALLARELRGARVLFVTHEPPDALARDAVAAGLPEHAITITRADFADMPAHVRLMDLGVFFIKPCFSKLGSAATKLAELLGTGVPVVINDGIGDSGRIVSAPCSRIARRPGAAWRPRAGTSASRTASRAMPRSTPTSRGGSPRERADARAGGEGRRDPAGLSRRADGGRGRREDPAGPRGRDRAGGRLLPRPDRGRRARPRARRLRERAQPRLRRQSEGLPRHRARARRHRRDRGAPRRPVRSLGDS
jgi:glycosyltransferase involved in cell wall biosynthesis